MDRLRIEYKEKDCIGTGEFGKVYKGKLKLQKEYEVAIKTIKNLASETQKKNFVDECNLMKKLKHDKIVKLYCICTKEEPLLMVFEYMLNGSLRTYLKVHGTKFELKILIDIIAQITTGMKFLESILVVHSDLSARNILVGKDNLVKIADFGLAEKLNDMGRCEKVRQQLPIKWMAPEVLNSLAPAYTIKSDVW